MKTLYRTPRSVLVLLVSLLLPGIVVLADNRNWEDDDHSYDRARRAVAEGEILSIAELLEQMKTEVPGEVVGIELEREDGAWIYEFKVVDDSGHRLEVYVDGVTGTLLSQEPD